MIPSVPSILKKIVISTVLFYILPSPTMTDAITNTFFEATSAAGTTVEVDFGNKAAPKKYAIGYWSIRGLGAPITMMMCAAKIPFTLFLYDIVEKGEGGWSSEYFAAKGDYIDDFKQPLWNLPFCIDREDERVIAQTNAAFAHIGRACGMLGDNPVATSECEQLLCEIYDLRNVMVGYAYSSEEVEVSSVIARGKKHLLKLEKWMEFQAEKGDGNGALVHLVDGKFSAADFHLYEMLDQFEALAKEQGTDLYANNDLKRMKEFKENFETLPENKFYLDSWLHKELPFNNCMARFGSLPGPKTYVHGESSKIASWRGKGVIALSP
uniref:glutathione transferase n=1 Tax=Pseudo-nitzschia australis TaxID=44445 RepID=A0A7S4ARR8_9STRA|mmetsp:Transcript_13776/g.28920  ORF Transcript_13776/g.28920 Transcript_13776/m.28920 type:complete len:324 (+) Transcript_13776:140-1111(+)